MDGDGTPLGEALTGANVNDSRLLPALLDVLPAPVREALDEQVAAGTPPVVHGDAGYDSERNRRAVTDRGLVPDIPRQPRARAGAPDEGSPRPAREGWRARARRKAAQTDAERAAERREWLGPARWVVERTFAWLNQDRRLAVRYERKAEMAEALLRLGCALVCWRALERGREVTA